MPLGILRAKESFGVDDGGWITGRRLRLYDT